MPAEFPILTAVSCYHCGEECAETSIDHDEKTFCCQGCRMVYDILDRKGLCDYYAISPTPGLSQRIKVREGKFSFLDHPEVELKLLDFSCGSQKHVTFYLPQMHCSSCIWLLEHLPRLDEGVLNTRVNYPRKEVSVIFDSGKLTLSKVAELLATIGYEPHISLRDLGGTRKKSYNRARIYRIGVAGFCFGNIMLLSFPDYLGLEGAGNADTLSRWFSWLNLLLSLPVFFYCSAPFFVSAWKSLKQKFLNIDAPIALAILMAFGRSVYEIISGTGAGYMDSMAGIVFFMLAGRYLQDRTQESLSFDRDYTAYFPLGVSLIGPGGEERAIPVSDIRPGHRVRIHSQEIIPADGMLVMGKASIDYSFVTGESLPVDAAMGELVYAGGRQTGGAIELEVVKEVSQSYLTRLWNDDAFGKKGEERKVSFIHAVSRYFTIVLFSIAIATAAYWSINEPSRVWNAVTAILIIACPCSLLLSATFTNGAMLAVLQRHRFYLKNASVLESIAGADTIVFDKTGTISLTQNAGIRYEGEPLEQRQASLVLSLASQSSHPMSRAIAASLRHAKKYTVKEYREESGRGSTGIVRGSVVKLGSASFTGTQPSLNGNGSEVHVSVDGRTTGRFSISAVYRPKMEAVVRSLASKYRIALLSGDNNSEEGKLREVFGSEADMRFSQSPHDKLNYIRELQSQGGKVIMIGDGLNDAGALRQSDAGIAITDDVNNFTPGSDAILDGGSFRKLSGLLAYCGREKPIIYASFALSIVYNIAGLYFAVQGTLSPLIAAILMPASSVSIMLFTSAATQLYSRKIRK